MASYFELYDMPTTFHPDPAAVKNKFYQLSRQYHPDRYAHAGGTALAEALQMAALNNQAYKTLKDTDATMAYVLKQEGLLEEEEKYALPPAFLMEMMDLNEAISDYEADPTNTSAGTQATEALTAQLNDWQTATNTLTHRHQNGDHTQPLLIQIKDQYFRKKYLLRIKQRIDRFAR